MKQQTNEKRGEMKMGHLINSEFLNAKTKTAALKEGLAKASEFAYYNGDRMEGSDSYHGDFKFYDKVFDNEEDALDFFNKLGSYRDGIVQVKEAPSKSKKKCAEIEKKCQKKKLDLVEKCKADFMKRTSKTVGCKKCGTRITKEKAYHNRLYCPNCRNWMVSDSIKKRYNKYDEQIELANEELMKAQAQYGKLRYFAKFEIHI